MKPIFIIIIVIVVLAVIGGILYLHFRNMIKMPGEVTDKTKKNAPKTIKSEKISKFDAEFVYANECGELFYHFKAKRINRKVTELTGGLIKMEKTIHTGPEFLVELQKIIDKYNLASKNGIYRVTSGLPNNPTRFLCKYRSCESIRFYIDNDSKSAWMKEVYELFSTEFGKKGERKDFLSDSEMTRFHFRHGGMAMPQIYSFTIEKKGDKYLLKANFSNPENSYKEAEVVWDKEEEQDIVKGFYDWVLRIYYGNQIYLWDGFDGNNRFVKDGTMFNLSVDFENGEKVRADGNNSFPEKYYKAHKEIEKLLEEIIKVYQERGK